MKRAVQAAGTQIELGRRLGQFDRTSPRHRDKREISQSVISEWACGRRPVPAGRCAQVEFVVGAAVTAEELRPDLKWVRVPDQAWPHPAGRPVVDVNTFAKAA